MFRHLADPFWLRETAPPWASQFLKTMKGPAGSMPLIDKPRNPEPHFLCGVCTPRKATSLCFNHPRARDQAARGHPYSPKPTIVTKLANPLFFLPCIAFPQEMPGKAVAYVIPAPVICLLAMPLSFPRSPARTSPLASRPCAYNKLFPEPFLCLLLYLHLTDQTSAHKVCT